MTLAAVAPPESASTHPRLLTVRPAPRREPPFDDEIVASRGASPFDRPLPFPSSATPAAELRPRYDVDLPDPTAWGRRLLIGLSEAAADRRPMHQLTDLLTPSIAQGIGAELNRAKTAGATHWLRNAVPRSIRTMQPCAGVAEISATMTTGKRVRAVAIRIERRHGQWRCTRIVLG